MVLVLTLTEKVTLTTPYYKFVFTHVLTGEEVSFVKSVLDDESGYQSRYNQFTIDPSVVFADKPVGEWHYKVYEQEEADSEDTTSLLEEGKMIMDRAEEFSMTQYDSDTTFKAYNG